MTNQQDSDNEKIVFSVTVGDLQQESVRLIGRELTDEELDTASDEVDWGLSTGIFIVFKTAIEDAVDVNR